MNSDWNCAAQFVPPTDKLCVGGACKINFRSYEIGFNDFDFQFMGWSAGWMPKLSGGTTRTVGMLVMDKNTDPFHVEVELIEGLE